MERLLERHPLLCPDGEDAYAGYVMIGGADQAVRIVRPRDGGWANAVVHVSPALAAAIGPTERLHDRIQRSQCKTVMGVVQELVEYAQQALLPGDEDAGGHAVDRFGGDDTAAIAMQTLLVEELDVLGWHAVSSVKLDRIAAVLTASDSHGVHHQLEVVLPVGYPTSAPKVAAALPTLFEIVWPPAAHRNGRLAAVLEQFVAELERHQRLWRELRLIDERCWVLEPTHPTPKDVVRRVVVGNNTSVQLTLDPNYPGLLPECRFLGPEHTVGPLRTRLSLNSVRWDDQRPVLDNFEAVLEVECLPPAAQQSVDFALECGICYSYQLDGVIPERVCEDKRCARAFHAACLYEYIKGLPEVRQSFGTFFGSCPYCSTPLTVKLPS